MMWKCEFCDLKFSNPADVISHEYYAHLYRMPGAD